MSRKFNATVIVSTPAAGIEFPTGIFDPLTQAIRPLLLRGGSGAGACGGGIDWSKPKRLDLHTHSLRSIHEVGIAELKRALASKATRCATAPPAELKVTAARLLTTWIERRRPTLGDEQISLPFHPGSSG